jgi:hypothetical protein
MRRLFFFFCPRDMGLAGNPHRHPLQAAFCKHDWEQKFETAQTYQLVTVKYKDDDVKLFDWLLVILINWRFYLPPFFFLLGGPLLFLVRNLFFVINWRFQNGIWRVKYRRFLPLPQCPSRSPIPSLLFCVRSLKSIEASKYLNNRHGYSNQLRFYHFFESRLLFTSGPSFFVFL